MKSIESRPSASKPRNQAGIPSAMMFCGLAICMACGWLGLQVAGPLEQASRLHGENDALERTLRRAELRNQEARKEVKAIGTDQGAILAARTRGYMFAHEHPLHIQSEGSAKPAASGDSPVDSSNGNDTRLPNSADR